jgi:hypothetical protein
VHHRNVCSDVRPSIVRADVSYDVEKLHDSVASADDTSRSFSCATWNAP